MSLTEDFPLEPPEPRHRFQWGCICGFTHISECTQTAVDETMSNRALCPACRYPLSRPYQLKEPETADAQFDPKHLPRW